MKQYGLNSRARWLLAGAAMIWLALILAVLPGGVKAADTPIPAVSLTVPPESFIGETLSFTASFSNTSGTDPGYGPYIDLIFPVNGADGAPNPDGINFSSATYLGQPITAIQLPFPAAPGCVSHPYALDSTGTPVQVCGNPGDKLVVLQLPFGSFTPGQPPAAVTVNATVSNLADLGTPLTIQARGGFQFGADPLNNPTTDPTIIGTFVTANVTPTVLKMTKTYIGPENETATGPNYPRQYRITVDLADGQTITDLDLTDILPNNLQFVQVDSTTIRSVAIATTAIATPSTTMPGGTLTRRFASVTGTTAGNDATLTFTFYVPLNASDGNPVIDAATGDDATSIDDAKTQGSWTPIDTRDAAQTVSSDATTNDHTLTDKSIAIQKNVGVYTDTLVAGPTPGDTLQYTLTFQISDFFAFQGIVITDTISDGQHLDASFTPTLSVNGNTFTLVAAPMAAANYSVICNYSPTGGLECGSDDPATNDGTTTLYFRVSDELVTRGQSGKLIGGCVPVAGTEGPAPNCDTTSGGYNNGATTGTIKFRTTILDKYTDIYPSGDASLNQGDAVNNDVTIDGQLLSVANTDNLTGASEADGSSAGVSLAGGALSKTIYALNGVVCSPQPCTNMQAAPGYTLTYRVQYQLLIGDFEDLRFTDYLPLPVFKAVDPNATGATAHTWTYDIAGNATPTSGSWQRGPADTQFTRSSIVPTVTTDATSNYVKWTYGTYDDPTNVSATIDILFTVTVSADPFADGLFLTNQARAEDQNTNSQTSAHDEIVQFQLTEPVLNIKKGVVATDNPAGIFSPTTVGPVTFTAPGSVCPRWTGTVNSTNLAATPINSNLSGIDAGDRVTFAIVVENTGSGLNGVFDVQVKESLPAGFAAPGGGLNLCAADGTGATINTTNVGGGSGLLDQGIELVDPGPTANPPGALDPYNATSGRNIAVITFDLIATSSVTPGQTLTDTATLSNYAGAEGGPDHTTTDPTDTATVTIAVPQESKAISGTNQAFTAGNNVAIGEIITYTVAITVPEGTTPGATLTDVLDQGLGFVNCVSVTPSSAALTSSIGAFSNACNPPTNPTVGPEPVGDGTAVNQGRRITFNLGTLTNSDTANATAEKLTVTYRAVVLNSTANVKGQTRKNTATFAWTGGSLVQSAPVVTVVEPKLQVTKAANPTTGDAGDTVTFTMVVSHASGSNADAFNAHLSDVIPAGMTYVADSLASTGVSVPDSLTQSGGTISADWTNFLQGSTSTITFQVTLTGGVTPNQSIINTANITWTSLPGVVTTAQSTYNTLSTERTGVTTDPGGAANNYTASGAATVTVTNVAPTKSIVATSEASTAAVSGTERVAIGEIVRYHLAVQLPEGASTNFQLRDQLPVGLRFINDSTAKVAFVANGVGISSSTITTALPNCAGLNVTGNSGSVTPTCPLPDTAVSDNASTNSDNYVSGTDPYFKLGNLTNGDSDADGEFVVVEFNALVENVSTNQAFNNATNAASATNRDNNFQVLVGGSTLATSTNVRVTIAEPVINNLSKTVTTTPADAGDTIVYQLTYSNVASGNDRATAFDVSLTDTLNSNLNLQSVAVTAPVGSTPSDTSTLGVGGVVRVVVDKLPPTADIPGAVKTVTIVVTAKVVAAAPNGLTIPNTANLTYTSLPGANGTTGNPTDSNNTGTPGTATGERTGADGAGNLNDYVSSSSISKILATPTIVKLAPTPTTYTIGDTATYNIRVTLPEGATPNLRVTDVLPAGLGYVSYSVITTAAASGGLLTADYNGTLTTSPACTGCTAGASGTLTFTFGNTQTNGSGPINGTSNNQFLVRVVAKVLNVSTPLNQIGTTLQNTANLIYDDPTLGNDHSVAGGSQTVTVIEPRIVTTKAVTPATAVEAGTVLNYTVTFTNNGTSPAYDVTAQDALAQGVTFTALQDCTLQPDNTAVLSTATVDVSGSPVTFDGNLAGSWDIPVGKAIVCHYTATAQSSLYVDGGHTNTVDADWSSQDGVVAGERIYDDTPGYTVDGTQDTAMATFAVAAPTFAKSDGGTTQATIGNVIHYVLTITSPKGTLHGLTVKDLLPKGLIYNGDAVVSSNISPAPAPTVSTSNDGSAAVTLTWGFGDAVVTANPAQITFSATVANVLSNQAGVVLNNTATLDHSNAAGDAQPALNAADDVTVVEPSLTLNKVVQTAPSPADAGGTVAYRVTFANATGVTVSTAFDTQLVDTLPVGLSLNTPAGIAPTFSNCGSPDPAVTNTSTSGAVQLVISALIPGCSVTVDYSATILDTALAGDTVDNTANLTYTSLSGAETGERDGSGGINDYQASDPASFTLNAPAIDKLMPDPASYTLGEIVTYNILVTLPEGTTQGLVVVDDLPAGLDYVASSAQVITSASGSGGLLAADFNGTLTGFSVTAPGGSGADVTVTFTGDAVTAGDNVTNNNAFLVQLQARVLNVIGNQIGTVLTNNASVRYTDPETGVTTINDPTPPTITVIEPRILTAKAVTPAMAVQAGTLVTYTVTFTNNGTSPAYDVTAQDTLAQGVTFTALVDCKLDGTAIPSTATPGGSVVTFDGNPAGSWDISVGKALVCQYTATAQSSLYVDGGHTNTVDADWSSLNGVVAGERIYDDTPGYTVDGTQDTATATFTVAAPTFAKTDGGTTQATIGDVIHYTLTLTSPLGTLRGLTVQDLLPAGLIYNGDAAITGVATAPTFTASTPNNGTAPVTLTWSFGDAVVTASPAQITFTATVANVPSNQDGVVLNNTATLDHNDAAGSPQPPLNGADDVRLVPPAIGLAKQVIDTPSYNGDGTYDVTYAILVQNIGEVALHDVQVTDDLAATFAPTATFTVVSVTSAKFAVNSAGYDGSGDSNLLATGNSLAVHDEGVITLVVRVNPGGFAGPYNNNATGSAVSPGQVTVSDVSTNGADPDPGSSGNTPAENGNASQYNVPTPVSFATASVGDLVWWDINGNGQQDSGEPGIPGVTVLLRNAAGAQIAPDVTTSSGIYTFTKPAGAYTVTIAPAEFAAGGTLENWLPTVQNTGSDATDSDGDANHEAAVVLTPGQQNMTIDFGFTITSTLQIVKRLNTPDPVRPNREISFTIQITNTGKSWITFLPLHDAYNSAYLTYGFDPHFATPDSVSHDDSGSIDWTDLTAAPGADLAPGTSTSVVVYFTSKAGTSHLVNGETVNTASVTGAQADPDGPNGPLGSLATLEPQQSSAGVQIFLPTGLGVSGFSAAAQADGVRLLWQTAVEAQIAGFNVLRKVGGGEFAALNSELLFAQHAGANQGGAYSFVDAALPEGMVIYALQVVRLDGSVEAAGQVEVAR